MSESTVDLDSSRVLATLPELVDRVKGSIVYLADDLYSEEAKTANRAGIGKLYAERKLVDDSDHERVQIIDSQIRAIHHAALVSTGSKIWKDVQPRFKDEIHIPPGTEAKAGIYLGLISYAVRLAETSPSALEQLQTMVKNGVKTDATRVEHRPPPPWEHLPHSEKELAMRLTSHLLDLAAEYDSIGEMPGCLPPVLQRLMGIKEVESWDSKVKEMEQAINTALPSLTYPSRW